jgi:hypothetical protein
LEFDFSPLETLISFQDLGIDGGLTVPWASWNLIPSIAVNSSELFGTDAGYDTANAAVVINKINKTIDNLISVLLSVTTRVIAAIGKMIVDFLNGTRGDSPYLTIGKGLLCMFIALS